MALLPVAPHRRAAASFRASVDSLLGKLIRRARGGWPDLLDRLAAAPAVCWFGLSIHQSLNTALAEPTGVFGVSAVALIANAALLGVIIMFLLTRRPPVLKAHGFAPRCAAIAGMLAPVGLAAAPPAQMSREVGLLSSGLVLCGTLMALVVMLYLRRSFSIFPQARALATGGPYRFVRHPLYLAEFVTFAGLSLGYAQPWATMMLILAIVVQLPRIWWEERVLTEAFPTYQEYARRSSRLIPFLY